MAVLVGFRCDVISCELAQRGVRHGAAKSRGNGKSSTCGRGNAAGLTLILDRGQFFLVSCMQPRQVNVRSRRQRNRLRRNSFSLRSALCQRGLSNQLSHRSVYLWWPSAVFNVRTLPTFTASLKLRRISEKKLRKIVEVSKIVPLHEKKRYRERKCADTIGTVLVPWSGYFQC